MEWLMSVLYGLVSGLTEFFPVSSGAHQAMLLRIFGQETAPGLLKLMTHLGCLIGLLVCCRSEFSRLRRARKQARSGSARRRQSADVQSVLTLKMLRTAMLLLIVGFLFSASAAGLSRRLNLIAVFLVLNGILLFVPQLFARGNKDARSVSRLDGMLLGLGSGLSVIPGFSRVGAVVSLAALRGAGNQFALHFALLLSVPALVITMGIDLLGMITGGFGALGVQMVIRCLLSGCMAFLGSWCSILTMRFLSVKAGFSGFAYYCWGAALFSFILFMMI